MDFRRLRYFLAVAEEQHFTRAAQRLGIRQPPLSAQIRGLEDEIGTPLFQRGSRNVTLTDAGKVLLKEAREILERIDKAEILVQRYVRGEIGSMIVGFGAATYLAALVPAIIRAYRERYPDVRVHAHQSNTFDLVNAIREGTVDAAFIRPPIARAEDLRLEPVVDEEMVAVLPHGHSLANATAVDLPALSEETFTMPPRSLGPGYYDSIIAAFHRAGFAPHIGQEASTLAAIPSLVAAGFGVSVLPRSLDQLCVDHVVYRPLDGNGPRASIALACPRTTCAAAVRNLIGVARKCVRDSKRAAG